MAFTDLLIRQEYRSLLDDVVKDFYTPVLKESVLYRRAVGFFSSSALIELTKGIAGLINNGGRIELIASPKLSEEDIAAIEDGFKRRDEVIEASLLRELHSPKGKFEEARLNLLSNLIAAGILEIKIAFLEDDNHIGMFHEKMGLMYDDADNIIAFTGSMNESANAFSHNYESIDVYTSWTSDIERVLSKQSAFTAMWEDYEPHIKVMSFPSIEEEIIRKYKQTTISDFTCVSEIEEELTPEIDYSIDILSTEYFPHVPTNVHIRSYQNDAICAWREKKYRGIFDMATGTGKTYTALAAIAELYKDLNQNLGVIIVCPYQHLVEQWKEDIVAFGMKPIICYSASKQSNWRERLKNAAMSFTLGVQNHFCMVATNATFSTDYVQQIVKRLNGNILLIVDEAHNFGAENLSMTLLPNIKFRLALSATIDRYGDPEGTKKLYDYFGEKCIEYTLKDAIDNDMLTPYYYHPIVVSLSDSELASYMDLTTKIRKNVHTDHKGKAILNEYAKMLLIKRARIVAGASEKLPRLREIIEEYRYKNHMLVYCGATTMRDADYSEEHSSQEDIRQIDAVADMLGNGLKMRISKFTAEENADERERIKADFAEGTHLQALVAIRCLDEGVNIPSIDTAFILASSTNPKEYVQRRGRVLRKYPGKKYAVIYDFVTLPVSLEELDAVDDEIIEGSKSLAIREIERMKDFAAIAENPFDSDELIAEIQDGYRIECIIDEEEYYV